MSKIFNADICIVISVKIVNERETDRGRDRGKEEEIDGGKEKDGKKQENIQETGR